MPIASRGYAARLLAAAGGAVVLGLSSGALAQSVPVTNGLQIWYDPDNNASVTTDGTGRIVAINDQSPNGNTATVVPNAQPPLLAQNQIAGRDVINFTTTNEALQAGADPGIDPQEGWTYFAVLQPQTFTNGALNNGSGSYFVDRANNPFNFGGNPLASLKAVNNTYGVQVRYDDGSGLGGPTATTPIDTTGGLQIVTWKRNYDGTPGDGNDQFEIYVNNVLEGTSPDSGANMTLDAPVIGRHGTIVDGGYTGFQGDFLVYDRALTAAEQTAVYDFLQAKYVPEPSGLLLLGGGAFGLLLRRRRRA